ncbi:DUF5011 domain-containing protein [Vibrio coralliilyticus]|uniref:chitinase n=1 Tax=Vibrio coralliilyticus TaxID=190893 RepID=A0AAN0VZJ5_9VIBR|nr:immunoglobulin-like domain-containing protein [Vibrio coralliilyticus]AIW21725.1 chitinase [Vibrio coralliilyticus]NOH38976.1 DUF5011 domain-containing protein [Vibrio coralliilyticus]
MNKRQNKKLLALSIAVGATLSPMSALASAQAGQEMVNPTGMILEGYWHNWCNVGGGDGYRQGSSACIQLNEVPRDYNVVMVSFMKVFDETEGRIPTFRLDPALGMSEQDFIKQIGELNAQGRSVLISMGGANAHIAMQSGDEQPLAEEIIRLTELYGFDGLDIDLEQSAIREKDNEQVIVDALKIVKEHYRKSDKNFIIAMAPEFPNLRHAANQSYKAYIENLEGYYDWISPQFYNQAGDGVNGDYSGEACSGWLAQNNDECKKEFIYWSSYNVANGIDGYVKIPHDKLVYGIPANNDAANNGFVKDPQDLFDAFAQLEAEGLGLRGIMTWSVNWDLGKDSADKPYDQQFVNTYGPFIHGGDVDMPPVFSGTQDTEIFVNTEFDEMAGVTASDEEDGDLTSKINHEGEVDESRKGVYTIIYRVTDSGNNTTTDSRLVTVKDDDGTIGSKPEIHGVEDTTSVLGQFFDTMLGVSALDSEDGNITAQIMIEGNVDTANIGDNTLTYRVEDSDGNEAVEVRNVQVINEAPVLHGISDVSITVGDEFDALYGVTAHDSTDGDLTSRILVDGEVNSTEPGRYALVYSVSDFNGATTIENRNVTVNEASVCVIHDYPDWPRKDWEGGEYNHADKGDLMRYEGVVYEAQWYTTTVPGSDSSWIVADGDCQSEGNQAPDAIINGPASAIVGSSITLDGSQSVDHDGSISNYQWSWNGVVLSESSSSLNVDFTQGHLGQNVFTLVVADNEGLTDSVEHTVNVKSDDGGTDPGVCEGIPAYQTYDPSTGEGIYMTGDQVAHKGDKYEALTDNLYNIEPGTADHWWKPLGSCE